jgi:hypothetical protein
MRCPSAEEMFDLLRGKLTGERAQSVRDHVSGCAGCAATADWLAGTLSVAAEGPLPEPPAEVLERAFEIVPRKPATSRPARRGWALSRLVVDSLTQPLPAGVRGTADAGRRLLYHADGADLDLEVRETPGDRPVFRVTGQLLIPGAEPPLDLLAVLWSGETVVAHTPGDELGLFVFPEVPAGSYRLEVWVPGDGRGLRIEPFELGGSVS